jgi:hypothetical protein
MKSDQLQRRTLSQSHVGSLAIELAQGLASSATLDLRMRLRLGLSLSARGLGVYPEEELMRRGREAGMNGAEMAANLAGTSHDAQATVCLAFAAAVLDGDDVPQSGDCQAMTAAGYTQDQMLEVIAHCTLHQLMTRLCAVIATQDGTARNGQPPCASLIPPQA